MKYNETHFAKLVACQKKYPEIYGQVEASLQSKAGKIRVDILTDKHAFECKFGSTSWKTALGQAMTYAMLADRKPGIIVFIRTNPKYHDKDLKGFSLLEETISHFKLKVEIKKFYVNQVDGTISKYNSLDWVEPDAPVDEILEVESSKPTGFFNKFFK